MHIIIQLPSLTDSPVSLHMLQNRSSCFAKNLNIWTITTQAQGSIVRARRSWRSNTITVLKLSPRKYIQTAQLSQCHHKIHNFNPDLTVTGQCSHFLWPTVTDHDRHIGGFHSANAYVTVIIIYHGIKTQECWIAMSLMYATYSRW